eukprot:TRINITY_DN31584_c0_g1_i1.p1 TRINITY_DN31584_c0_g1~~TRINITY_DN31584_c0_g1_i1.p1  ORF type:complete len:154 (+),score=4.54 TRINITY_DN31584_c0_g1_i1:457-918(+)
MHTEMSPSNPLNRIDHHLNLLALRLSSPGMLDFSSSVRLVVWTVHGLSFPNAAFSCPLMDLAVTELYEARIFLNKIIHPIEKAMFGQTNRKHNLVFAFCRFGSAQLDVLSCSISNHAAFERQLCTGTLAKVQLKSNILVCHRGEQGLATKDFW